MRGEWEARKWRGIACGVFLEARLWEEEFQRGFLEEGETEQILHISFYSIPCKFLKKIKEFVLFISLKLETT